MSLEAEKYEYRWSVNRSYKQDWFNSSKPLQKALSSNVSAFDPNAPD